MLKERLKILLGCIIPCLILCGLWLLGGVDSSVVEMVLGLMVLVVGYWSITADYEKKTSTNEKES